MDWEARNLLRLYHEQMVVRGRFFDSENLLRICMHIMSHDVSSLSLYQIGEI